jgi:hypothetical protein
MIDTYGIIRKRQNKELKSNSLNIIQSRECVTVSAAGEAEWSVLATIPTYLTMLPKTLCTLPTP